MEGQSPSSEEINHSNWLVTRAPHTWQLMKAGAHRNRPAPRLTQGPGYPPGMAPPLSQVLSGCPITPSGALGPPRGLAKPRPGPANSPFLGETHSSASPFLCALFFVLLKFSPSCRGVPSSTSALERGGGSRELLETQTVQRSCVAGGPPVTGPLIVYAGWMAELALVQMAAGGGGQEEGDTHPPTSLHRHLTSPGEEQGASHSSGTLARHSAAELKGQRTGTQPRAVGACQIASVTRKEKALYFPFVLPGRKRKLPRRRLRRRVGKRGIWFELAESTPPPDTHSHTHAPARPPPGSPPAPSPIPAQLPRRPGHSPAAARRAERLTRDAPGAGGRQFCAPGRRALRGGGGATDGRSRSTAPSR